MTDSVSFMASAVVFAQELTAADLPPVGRRSGADSGDPQVASRVISIDPESGTEVGIWTCTPGGWPIESRQDTEMALILCGRAVITDEGGERRELGAGDAIVLPIGWSGRWDVLEDVRKLYAVVTPSE